MTKKELGDLAWVKDPFIMFIAKTWTNEARLKKVKCSLKFDHMFLVPLIHKWGGGGACSSLEGFNKFESGSIF